MVPHAAGLAHLTGANARFHAAVRNLTVGDDTDILHISPELIREYLDDPRLAGLL